MAREFYPPDVLRESRRLYEGIRSWAAEHPATIIGGWAVFELVSERAKRQSRDIDIVLHTIDACQAFDELLPSLGLVWDLDGKQKRMACLREGDANKEILVDVFTPHPFIRFFGNRHCGDNPSKPAGFGLFPPVGFMVRDKVETVPKRRERDAQLKKVKDLVDLRDLVLHNRDGILPRPLLSSVDERARDLASFEVQKAIDAAPEFRNELEEARQWLRMR